MRMLLLTCYFPPAFEVGAIRPARLARSMAEAGHSVEVLTVARPGLEAGPVANWPGVTIHPVHPWPGLRDLGAALRLVRPRRRPASGKWAAALAPRSLRRAWLDLLWLPDRDQGFIPSAFAAALALIREQRIDLLYATAPPFSVHLAGTLISRVTGVPSVIEYRDPWDKTQQLVLDTSRWAAKIERGLQMLSLRSSSLAVAVTDGIAAELVRRWGASAALPPIVTAANGIDQMALVRPSAPGKGPLTIVHAGELYLGRDPGPFLRTIAALRRRRGWSAADLQIEFLGEGRWYLGESVEQLVGMLGIEDLVVFRESIPHDQCLARLASADILLLLAQGQPLQVPNKLYDYLGARRPILAYVDEGGESDRLLSTLAHHVIIRGDGGSNGLAAVDTLLANGRLPPLDPEEPGLAPVAWAGQWAKLWPALEAVAGGTHDPRRSRRAQPLMR